MKANVIAVSLMVPMDNESRLRLYEYRKRKYQQKPQSKFSIIIYK